MIGAPSITLSGNSSKNVAFSTCPASFSSSNLDQTRAFVLAGHVSTQTPQPVQSSQYTCNLYCKSFSFLVLDLTTSKLAGLFANSAGATCFARTAA